MNNDEVIVFIDIDAFDPNEDGEPVEIKDVPVKLDPEVGFPGITNQAVREAQRRDLDYSDWEISSEYK